MDLSSPHGHSINDGIQPEQCTLKYAAIIQALPMIQALGKGSLKAKTTFSQHTEWYEFIPVTIHCWISDGMRRRNGTLPSLWPKVCPEDIHSSSIALAWAMSNNGAIIFLHYLEDFLFIGPPNNTDATNSLAITLATCSQISFPVSRHKIVNPSHRLTFLGIEIDTISGTLTLTQETHQTTIIAIPMAVG